ncbi:hypothetical protein FA15DRAFT_758234 [Coprinopsis marcescibilis]|uniref:F-box domain-containing protein n=1 Tax=Coprinopsis marcescibilis TaxID=230819 RepID=A0A5C3L1T6_COPMA|nr:hypothetical protein FA15DRAFT_758234 [Coprinopsis marcescibilis]
MTVELPPEIWDLIAGHLQGDSLIPLMSLNRVFMQLAMREKYRVVNLAFINKLGHRRLETLRNEDLIAELVRSVYIGQVALSTTGWHPSPNLSFRGKFKSVVTDSYRKLTGKQSAKSHLSTISPHNAMNLVSDVLPRLKNVTTMSINYRNDETGPGGWRICDPSAQYLPFDIDFPKLTELRIHTAIICQFTGIMIHDTNMLAQFINKFQKTLTRLAYADFIKRHADSLRWLQCPIDSFSEALGPIEFSKLETIALTADTVIGWEPESTWWISASPFLKSILPTVRSLRISHWCTGEEIATFLETVTGLSGHVEPLLAELSICFQTFSIDALPVIASAFPKLRTLEITFLDIDTEGALWTSIQPDKTFPFTENRLKYVPFARRLGACLSGVTWSLQDITIKCQGGWFMDLSMWGLMHICGQLIPSITSFNSTGNMVLPEDVKIPPNYLDIVCAKPTVSETVGE